MGLFMCMICALCFPSASGLGRHHQATGHAPAYAQLGPPKRTRNRYSFKRKRDLVLDVLRLTRLYNGDAKQARLEVANRSGANTSNLDKWVRNREFIFKCARTRRLGGKYRWCAPRPRWPAAETQLYMRFLYRRRYQALRTTNRWLKINMKDIRHNLGDDVRGWWPSKGWATRFCKRWEITNQCRTNKKKFSIEERLPAIQGFHQYWIGAVQGSGPARCPKYGRFPDSHIYAMDQVPMPFSSSAKRSLNERGARRGNRFTAASEDDKRFCTLQVTLCGKANEQDVAVELIFDSRTQGEHVSLRAERAMYAATYPDVKVRWQAKAWADQDIILDYLRDFRRQTLHKGEVALVMDNHGSQHTDHVRGVMHFLDILDVYTPANCTDCVSPVDRNIGQWLKQRVYQLQEDEMDLPENSHWALAVEQGGLGKPQKRQLVVKWVAQAWGELKEHRQHCINSAFVDTGVLIAKDGSEDHLIRLRPGAAYGEYVY